VNVPELADVVYLVHASPVFEIVSVPLPETIKVTCGAKLTLVLLLLSVHEHTRVTPLPVHVNTIGFRRCILGDAESSETIPNNIQPNNPCGSVSPRELLETGGIVGAVGRIRLDAILVAIPNSPAEVRFVQFIPSGDVAMPFPLKPSSPATAHNCPFQVTEYATPFENNGTPDVSFFTTVHDVGIISILYAIVPFTPLLPPPTTIHIFPLQATPLPYKFGAPVAENRFE
jgi:hypothetical protein